MEKPEDGTHTKGKRILSSLEDLVFILDTHVDEAIKLVETELVPYLSQYIELCSKPQPESRVREEDIPFLFPK